MDVRKNKKQEKCVFHAWILNQEKSINGEDIGAWVSFPTTLEKIHDVFRGAGINFGKEAFIADFKSQNFELAEWVTAGTNIDELNYLANNILKLTDNETEKLMAIIKNKSFRGNVQDLINITENLGCFDLLKDVKNNYDLGHYIVNEIYEGDISKIDLSHIYIDYERFGKSITTDGMFTGQGFQDRYGNIFPEIQDDFSLGYYWINELGDGDISSIKNIKDFFDYEQFGKEMSLGQNGFYTSKGYIVKKYGLHERYNGQMENIPEKHIVMPGETKAKRKMNTQDQNENCLLYGLNQKCVLYELKNFKNKKNHMR